MDPRPFATAAAALTTVLAGCVVAWFAGFASAGIENTGAAPIVDHPPSLTADAELADAPQSTAMGGAAVESSDMAAPALVKATDTRTASDEPESIAEAALTDSSQMQPPETPSVQVATASTPDPMPNEARASVSSIDVLDECLVADICIDRYLWALYQRTPKEDSIKVDERRKATVKRRGKTVTVTKSFTRLVDEDFTWKDPKAAEKAGMPMMDYVIGGMDRSFKVKLYHALRAADEAGLSPGITSAYRDDYRQSIDRMGKAVRASAQHRGNIRPQRGDDASVSPGLRDACLRCEYCGLRIGDAGAFAITTGRTTLSRPAPPPRLG